MSSDANETTTRATVDSEHRLPLLLARITAGAWQRLRMVKLSFEYHRGTLQPIRRGERSMYKRGSAGGTEWPPARSGIGTLRTQVFPKARAAADKSNETRSPLHDDESKLGELLTALGEISRELDQTLSGPRLHQLERVQLNFVDKRQLRNMSEKNFRRFVIALRSAIRAMFPELHSRGLLDVRFSSRDGKDLLDS